MKKNQRRSPRYPVSIPCTVTWEGHPIRGEIADISEGGARIIGVNAIPPDQATVRVEVAHQHETVEFEAVLTSRVVYGVTRILDDGTVGFFGVDFLSLSGDARQKLAALLELEASR